MSGSVCAFVVRRPICCRARRLLQSGYRFHYPELDVALRHQPGATE